MHVAIVGGGLAAATAASELRERDGDAKITIYAAEPHLPYERPPLSKAVLLGSRSPSSTQLHDDNWYREHSIDVQVGVDVTSLDTNGHTIETSAGRREYDALILATGAQARRLEWAESLRQPTYYLRTVDDSVALHKALLEKPLVGIVGAGWIGLEVAAAARELGCDVSVFDVADLPLLSVLGPEVAAVVADLHVRHGVTFNLGREISPSDMAPFDIVAVGVGARPMTSLAASGRLAVDDGVLVDEFLRTSDQSVYAVGDVANQFHPLLGRRIRVEHWDNAIEQAKVAAANILGAETPYLRLPYFFSDQYDWGMEYFGNVGPAGYDTVEIVGDVAAAFQAYWRRGDAVVAAMHANDWDSSDDVKARVG